MKNSRRRDAKRNTALPCAKRKRNVSWRRSGGGMDGWHRGVWTGANVIAKVADRYSSCFRKRGRSRKKEADHRLIPVRLGSIPPCQWHRPSKSELKCFNFKKKKEKTLKWLTVSGHSEGQTFLETAVLASVAVDAVDDAVLLSRALVVDDGALRPPEESFASFARDHPIMDARTLVPTHFARDDLDLRCGNFSEKNQKISKRNTWRHHATPLERNCLELKCATSKKLNLRKIVNLILETRKFF